MWFDHFMDGDNSSSKIVMGIAVNGIRIPITEVANFANNNRRKSIETDKKSWDDKACIIMKYDPSKRVLWIFRKNDILYSFHLVLNQNLCSTNVPLYGWFFLDFFILTLFDIILREYINMCEIFFAF